MAETRRISSARPSTARRRTGPRPALPHPPRPHPPLRAPSEETIESQPAAREEKPAPPAPARTAEAPPRTGPERAVLAVLLLGLALNALVLLRHAALSPADKLLGATVLLAGVTLLVLMEMYRRAGR
jgi:hypothetical protein